MASAYSKLPPDQKRTKLATNARYSAKNKERLQAYRREYYRKNRERIRAKDGTEEARARKREVRQAYRERTREQYSQYMRDYRAANRDRMDFKQKARRYGVTVDQLREFLDKHDGRCDVCRDELGPNSKDRHLDHCHDRGKLRGLLCRWCNLALGHAKDDIARLEALLAYLRKHQQ
jgi:hypothetical protein